MCVGGYAFTAARSYNTSASVKLHLTMQMMQMKKNTSLTSPAAQKSQKITSNTTSKTLLPCTPKHHVISSLRSALSGQPPQTHFVRQTQLSWRLLRRLAFVIHIYKWAYTTVQNLHEPTFDPCGGWSSSGQSTSCFWKAILCWKSLPECHRRLLLSTVFGHLVFSPNSLLLGLYLRRKKGWPHSLAAPLRSVAESDARERSGFA